MGGAFLVVVTVLSQVVVMGFEEFHTVDVVCAFEHVVGA